jgi:hypothetical protein
MAVACGSDAKLQLKIFIQLPDENARHIAMIALLSEG